MTVVKIISGMQTGADQGGVQAAKRLGLESGGTMPRGFRTETGQHAEFAALYGAIESESGGYKSRTEINVMDSDGTVVFGNANSSGSKLTIKTCKALFRPYLHIELSLNETLIRIRRKSLRDWIYTNNIKVLNIAGNRESVYPGIQDFVENFLYETLKEIDV